MGRFVIQNVGILENPKDLTPADPHSPTQQWSGF